MSAKGRQRKEGEVYASPDHDDFPTPAWCVDRILDVIGRELIQPTLDGLPRWLEPCAGAGGIVRAVQAWCIRNHQPIPRWTGVEVQHRHGPELGRIVERGVLADFRLWARAQPPKSYAVAFTNPPFEIAEEVLDACQRVARVTVFLLRMPFMASEGRAPRLRAHCPDVFGLPNRPSFVEGASDNTDYCWARWPEEPRGVGSFRVLASTCTLCFSAEAAGHLTHRGRSRPACAACLERGGPP